MDYNFYLGEVILLNKPLGWSSFQAVNKIKHAIKNHPSLLVNGIKTRAKVGHAGTLDPLATGLLIVCSGKKTKSINEWMGQEKEYTGTFFIGATTPCFDLEQAVDKTYPTEHINHTLIYETAQQFIGSIQQIPPSYSAVMTGGRRAYELARAGIETELKPRTVEIKEFEITSIKFPEVEFRVVCSKGTYIRSLARDLGSALGSGAHLTRLCRTRIGDLKLQDAVTPVEFAEKMKG